MKTFKEIRNQIVDQLIEGKLKVNDYAGAVGGGDSPKKLGLKIKSRNHNFEFFRQMTKNPFKVEDFLSFISKQIF